ncbi:CmcI family methyltransferase [Mesorhizobium sp. DCY119]|uniref:CmcI family methyltransferase n=1 Tax=Mesorhizobium sp. DCY119 TaxID=2108445 RepID=UPI000E762678|nr:CmcI family methyltransferase [Mesorhizobium sp. DCY119]RJG40884.1 glycosyltransferase [Mesorhizobium sp. DCY119]
MIENRPLSDDILRAELNSLIFYPAVMEQEDFEDLISRIAWYFFPYLDKIEKIVLFSPHQDLPTKVPDILDPEIASRIPRIIEKITVTDPAAAVQTIRGLPDRNVALFVWDTDAFGDLKRENRPVVDNLRRQGRYYEVDHKRTRMEGSFYLWAGLNIFANQSLIASDGYQRFLRFAESARSNIAYIFGTGPTLSEFCSRHDFSDGCCIIANSMVKNDELLEKLQPVAVVAGDPIFHAGCSQYAGEFRRHLQKALLKTEAYFFVPLRDYCIYLSCLPPELHNRVVPVPFDKGKPYNIDLSEDFYVNPLSNVLTLLLFPLGGSIAKEVHIVGCDGRPVKESGYFWTHDKASQFNSEMDNIQLVHPGFFNIDYNDYYLEHCENVLTAVETLERSEKQVISLTPSFIPALKARQVLEKISTSANASTDEILCLDPDALDHFGHFLSYDSRLAATSASRGIRFRVLGHEKFDPNYWPESMGHFHRVFSRHSWTVGNRPRKGANATDVAAFETELDGEMRALCADDPDTRRFLYMYCGSVEHAEVVFRLVKRFPNIHANINLFWAFGIDESKAAYKRRWGPVVSTMVSEPRLRLTVMTEQQSDDYFDAFGVHLPVAPHPSTTFSDTEANELVGSEIGRVSDKPTILFPGGMRPEKGFQLSVDSALLLNRKGFNCTVRGLVVGNTDGAMRAELDRLSSSSVRVSGAPMDDDEFKEFLREADVIVCPYLPPDFARRTSGIVIDSLLLGKPVVVVKGTWLATIVEEYAIGVACDANADAIARGVENVLSHYDEFAAGAAKARTFYISDHSWDKLVASITEFPPVLTSQYSHTRALQQNDGSGKDTHVSPRSPIASVIPSRASFAPHGVKAIAERVQAAGANRRTSVKLPSTNIYSRFALWAAARNPFVFSVGQFAMWCFRTAWRHKPALLLFILVLVGMIAGAVAARQPWDSVLWAVVVFLAGSALLVAVIGFAAHLTRRSEDDMRYILASHQQQLRAMESRRSKAEITLHASIDQLKKHMLEISTEAEALSRAVDNRVSQLENEIRQHGERLDKVQAESSKTLLGQTRVSKSLATVAQSASVFSTSRYQRFNRTLHDDHVQVLVSNWAKPLGLKLNEKRLGYLAHRACTLEHQMKGRLATTVETIVLRSLVAAAPMRNEVSILEIGTLFGIGAAAMYEAATNESGSVHLTVIDPLDGYYAAGNRDLLTGAQVNEATLRQNWSLAPVPEDSFTIIKRLSNDPEAIKEAAQRQYDVVVIDGDHSYEGVKFDFENYSKLVRPGGYIIVDDYDVDEWPDIKRYVDSEVEGLPHLYRIGADFRTVVYQVKKSEPTDQTPSSTRASPRSISKKAKIQKGSSSGA